VLGANALPGLNAARSTPEQGMALWRAERPPLAIVRRATHGELPKQMLPLILQLPPCYRNGFDGAYRADLGAVKSVAARGGFNVDGTQVCADGITRRCVGPEPIELRVMAIAYGRAPKYRSSKERLTPEGNKPLRVEIARVNRPQPHWRLTDRRSADGRGNLPLRHLSCLATLYQISVRRGSVSCSALLGRTADAHPARRRHTWGVCGYDP
jgi:hypothetical protein